MRRKLHLIVPLRAWLIILFLGNLFPFSGTVLSQESRVQAANPSATYKLEGIVISSTTGEPIPRAYVQLSGDAEDAMLTGADGRFHFEGLPEGRITVFVSKPGFFENASCIWWEVAPAKGAPPHYSVCVGEADHLPRVVRSREHNLNYVYTLTKWNVTAVVLPAEAKIVAN